MSEEIFGTFENRGYKIFIPEAIVKLVPKNNIDEYKYDIAFDEKKRICSIINQPTQKTIHFDGSKSPICQNCYYKKLGLKLASLSLDQRDEFLEYQISIHKNPIDWLKSFLHYLDVFKNDLDVHDYGLNPDWKKLINQQIFNLEEEAKPTSKKIRLKTNLNVPQLAYMFKLLMDAKPAIFNIKTNNELYKFIEANFSTIGKTDAGPTEVRLNNLYSNVDKSTANFWVERLKKMLEDARNI